MAEVGDLDSLGMGSSASEGSEMSDEQFREQMQQAQAAMVQLRQEEGKARANDDKLAKIIVQFLAQPGNTDLFLLISRCIAQNIPSEIIIGVLSLVDRTAFMEMENILKEATTTALATPEHHNIHSLSGGQKQAIDEWLRNISIAAGSKPQRALESLLVKKTNTQNEVVQEISTPFIQLSAFIMRNFLAMQNTQVDYETLYEFMESVYLKMIQSLEDLLSGQRKLA